MMDRKQRRDLQHGWDALRSQLMAQFTRSDLTPAEEMVEPEIRRIFRVDDGEPYYGPTREAREAVSRLLGLDDSAGQLAWEIETRKRSSLEMLVSALGDDALDTEARSAIALLLLECAHRMGTELLTRLRWQLRRDAKVQARMRYWWTHMDGGAAVMEALS